MLLIGDASSQVVTIRRAYGVSRRTYVSERYWINSPWVDHACDLCLKDTPIEGEEFSTQAGAIDGSTST